jgi:ubiquinone/menaquinone biosynthesis C-methylase UbiE
MTETTGQKKGEMPSYHPEKYWSEVAEKIGSREQGNVIAGDDEPYYRYKRDRFIELFQTISMKGKKVLEVGPGPGGNLAIAAQKGPEELHGADISNNMIELAAQNLKGLNISLTKIDGEHLPFPDQYFDLVYTVTVLQHNTNEQMMKALFQEICRVSKKRIYLYEMVDYRVRGDELRLSRPVRYYEALAASHGFRLQKTQFADTFASYVFSGLCRKLLNPRNRKEGEALSSLSIKAQRLGLPLTQVLDKILKVRIDHALITFERIDP